MQCHRPTSTVNHERTDFREIEYLPALAEVLLLGNIDQGRRSSLNETFKSLLNLTVIQQIVSTFQSEFGLNPLTQIHQIAAAFTFSSSAKGPLAVAATLNPEAPFHLDHFLARAKQQATKFTEAHSKSFFSYQTEQLGLVYWPSDHRLLIATGSWADFPRKKAQSHVPSLANTHPEWADLRTDNPALFGFVAHIPWSLRKNLLTPQRTAPASIMSMTGGLIGFHSPRLTLSLELSNSLDARALSRELESWRSEASQHPDLLYWGLGPHLKSLRITQHEAKISISLTPSATEWGEMLEGLGTRSEFHKFLDN